jgi:glycerol-3-phosphate acyltransferase PlsY
VLELGLKVFLSYLVGSINGALLVGKFFGGVDIRKVGSGNAGGTNALRTQGKRFALFVMIIDIGKGVLPVLLLPGAVFFGIGQDPDIARIWLTYACGGAAIFGHCFPVWFDFAGGKGAATTIGVLGSVAPITLIPASMIWIFTLLAFGYVGLATVIASLAVPAFLAIIDFAHYRDLILFTGLVALFIIYTHRSNLRKLISGQATRDIRFSLLGRLSGQA